MCDASTVFLTSAIKYERLATPPEHMGMLIEPAADRLADLATADHGGTLDGVGLLDSTIGRLRRNLRRRLELAGPVVLTGHQAEFSHAGVFAKTIAVAALAKRLTSRGVFLSVDSDVPKAVRLAVPVVEAGDVGRTFVAIPGVDPRVAVEQQAPVPAANWRTFFDRVMGQAAVHDLALLREYVAGVFAEQPGKLAFHTVIERGDIAVERALGLVSPVRLRMSELSQTCEFRAFAAHLVLRAREFASCYNAAQAAYRTRRGERNLRRPAPPLAREPDRIELPLWICRAGQPRRRLFVASIGDKIAFFADGEQVSLDHKARLANVETHAQPWPLEEAGWCLRPRALMLSAFTRLFVADLFIHGIGGAKYDEMTEDFIGRFFGTRLPPAGCVTATLHLPLPCYGVSATAVAEGHRARRDLHYNPQRYLDDLPADLLRHRSELIADSDRLRTTDRLNRAERRRVFDDIRLTNRQLLHYDSVRSAAVEQRWRRLEHQWRSDRIAQDREFFHALHPRCSMEALAERIERMTGGCSGG